MRYFWLDPSTMEWEIDENFDDATLRAKAALALFNDEMIRPSDRMDTLAIYEAKVAANVY